ncbi:hypothetical protein BD413DRAFT_610695 [Trametes elegans]|nr:hypothetical protein BD413DRAFT_610695 [Trametes elegans]
MNRAESIRAEFCAYPPCLNFASGSGHLRCTRCRYTFYCSTTHRLQDARRHEAECPPPPPPPPATSTGTGTYARQPKRSANVETRMLSVLLFSADEDAPRIVRTECRVQRAEPDPEPARGSGASSTSADSDADSSAAPAAPERHSVDLAALLRCPASAVASHPVTHAGEPARGARAQLFLACSDGAASASDGTPPNRAARALAHVDLRGTLVGFRACTPTAAGAGTGAGRGVRFEDVTPADVPAFAAFLRGFGPSARGEEGEEGEEGEDEDEGEEEEKEGRERAESTTSTAAESASSSSATSGKAAGPPEDSGHTTRTRRVADSDGDAERLVQDVRAVLAEEFLRQRLALRAVVAEETFRAVLLTLAMLAGAYGVWRFVVLPILALPGLIIRLLEAVVGAFERAMVAVVRLSWNALWWVIALVVRR